MNWCSQNIDVSKPQIHIDAKCTVQFVWVGNFHSKIEFLLFVGSRNSRGESDDRKTQTAKKKVCEYLRRPENTKADLGSAMKCYAMIWMLCYFSNIILLCAIRTLSHTDEIDFAIFCDTFGTYCNEQWAIVELFTALINRYSTRININLPRTLLCAKHKLIRI